MRRRELKQTHGLMIGSSVEILKHQGNSSPLFSPLFRTVSKLGLAGLKVSDSPSIFYWPDEGITWRKRIG